MEKLENQFNVIINMPKNKLNHHVKNFLVIVKDTFDLVRQGIWAYDKNYLLERANHHIEGIRSTFPKIDAKKSQVLEEFCQIAAQVPDEVDDQYLQNLYSKFDNEIKEIIKSL